MNKAAGLFTERGEWTKQLFSGGYAQCAEGPGTYDKMTDNANVGQKRPADGNVRTSKRKRRRITATTPMVSVYEDEILEMHV